MSSESIINKYRPTAFKQVIGQDASVRSFEAVIKKGSSHTFLLSGPSGTGKTTLARIAAAQLGCTIQEIDAAKFTGIDDMRQITDSLSYRPLDDAQGKAIVLDEAHMLTKQAWASLLKSLEEPPEWCWWFLCTTDMGKVPENIKTRCTHYVLNLVASNTILDLIDDIIIKEKLFIDLEDEEVGAIASLCARHAQGSPRAALSALGACIAAKDRKEAFSLLASAEESNEAVDLARALLAGQGWADIRDILEKLKETNAESTRHVVRAYMTKVIMGAKKPNERHFAVLDAFGKPFPSGDGISPLVLACGSLFFAS